MLKSFWIPEQPLVQWSVWSCNQLGMRHDLESPGNSSVWGLRAETSLWDNSWVGEERSGSHSAANRIETAPSKMAKVPGSLVKSIVRAAVSSWKLGEWLQHSFKSICSTFVGYFSEFQPFYHWYRYPGCFILCLINAIAHLCRRDAGNCNHCISIFRNSFLTRGNILCSIPKTALPTFLPKPDCWDPCTE